MRFPSLLFHHPRVTYRLLAGGLVGVLQEAQLCRGANDGEGPGCLFSAGDMDKDALGTDGALGSGEGQLRGVVALG